MGWIGSAYMLQVAQKAIIEFQFLAYHQVDMINVVKVVRMLPMTATHSIESARHWKHSRNLSSVLKDSISRNSSII